MSDGPIGWMLEAPPYSVFDAVMASRRPSESLYAAAHRLLTIEALLFTDGHQADAAALLGTTPRVLNYYVRKYSLKQRWGNGGRRPRAVAAVSQEGDVCVTP